MNMTIQTQLAMKDLLTACQSLNALGELALNHSIRGLPLPWEEGEWELMMEAIALMYGTLGAVNPAIRTVSPVVHKDVNNAKGKPVLRIV